jgi:hypothetical protein
MSYPFSSARAEQSISPVSVCGINVNRDTAGRFSLNDLHRAAGGESRHRPNYWLGLDQTQELIAEIRKSLNDGDAGIPVTGRINALEPVVTMKGGKGLQGTFVVRELVYGYAMWISPAFHLHVIRTFDALATAGSAFRPGQVQGELFGSVIDSAKLAKVFGEYLRLAKQGGMDPETARRVADRLTRETLGVSPLAVLGVPANAPAYAVAEPAPGREVLPLTELLHRHGDPSTALEMHRKMERAGLLERRVLEAAGKPKRIYPVLVGDGLLYGDNVKFKPWHQTSHPMYYPPRFPELLDQVASMRAETPPVALERLVDKDLASMSKRQRAAFKDSGMHADRKERKRLDQRLAKQEAALDALARGEVWGPLSARLNLDYWFTPEERRMLRFGRRPIVFSGSDPRGEGPEAVPGKGRSPTRH